MNKYKLSYILVIISLLLLILGLVKWKEGEPERDGFKVLEKHHSYWLVEKDGHQYMATEGLYSGWSYEHYVKCPCNK